MTPTNSVPADAAQAELTTVEKLRGLPWGIAMNVANQVFAQLVYFGSVFVLFLDFLGLDKARIGFVLSLIPFANMLALWVAPFTARFGYKRTFVLFFGLRKSVSALLLLTPWVVNLWGVSAAFVFVTAVVAVFATFRSIEETAYNPWYQEFVPSSMMGKYAALGNLLMSLAGVISVGIAGYVLARSNTLGAFMALIAAGIVAGFISVWSSSHIPGGAPLAKTGHKEPAKRMLGDVLRDGDFLRYLAGVFLVTLGTVPVASFLPLFLSEQAGLSASYVVLVQIGGMAGTMASSYMWGWAADRYGSRPVLLTGVWLLVLMPLLWWLIPRQSEWSSWAAAALAFAQGVANLGWGIGASRLLFVGIVPPEKKSDYFAVYFAWAGFAAGLSQLAGGWLLEIAGNLSGRFWLFVLDPYAVLFLLGILCLIATYVLMNSIRSDSRVGLGEFAALFLRGNPFSAIGSLIGYYRAKDEHDTIVMTERLGRAKSPLTVNELLAALADPRFNVRFEALIAIAHTAPHPRLTEALVQILQGNNPALSAIAAWALGRLGDEQAFTALRQGLSSPYRSIQAHCARSLGAMGDHGSATLLRARLESEQDAGVRVAIASALGLLGVEDASRELLSLLAQSVEENERWELALALARIIDDESQFVQWWRAVHLQDATELAQAVTALKKQLTSAPESVLGERLERCSDALAHNDLAGGADLLRQSLELYQTERPLEMSEMKLSVIARDCGHRLGEFGGARPEYLLLTLYVLRKSKT